MKMPALSHRGLLASLFALTLACAASAVAIRHSQADLDAAHHALHQAQQQLAADQQAITARHRQQHDQQQLHASLALIGGARGLRAIGTPDWSSLLAGQRQSALRLQIQVAHAIEGTTFLARTFSLEARVAQPAAAATLLDQLAALSPAIQIHSCRLQRPAGQSAADYTLYCQGRQLLPPPLPGSTATEPGSADGPKAP